MATLAEDIRAELLELFDEYVGDRSPIAKRVAYSHIIEALHEERSRRIRPAAQSLVNELMRLYGDMADDAMILVIDEAMLACSREVRDIDEQLANDQTRS